MRYLIRRRVFTHVWALQLQLGLATALASADYVKAAGVESSSAAVQCMADILRARSDTEDIRTGTVSYDRMGSYRFVAFLLTDDQRSLRPIYAVIYRSDGMKHIVAAMGNDSKRIDDIAINWEMKCSAFGVLTTAPIQRGNRFEPP